MRFFQMWKSMMANSTIREIRVARAAPATPMAGAPRLPKMNTQFKKVLVPMEAASIYMPKLGCSMLRKAPIYTMVKPLNT